MERTPIADITTAEIMAYTEAPYHHRIDRIRSNPSLREDEKLIQDIYRAANTASVDAAKHHLGEIMLSVVQYEDIPTEPINKAKSNKAAVYERISFSESDMALAKGHNLTRADLDSFVEREHPTVAKRERLARSGKIWKSLGYISCRQRNPGTLSPFVPENEVHLVYSTPPIDSIANSGSFELASIIAFVRDYDRHSANALRFDLLGKNKGRQAETTLRNYLRDRIDQLVQQ